MESYRFRALMKETIWGGGRIAGFKGFESGGRKIGESWEISGVEGSESVVEGGEWDGRTISDLIGALGERLVGGRVLRRYGSEFPLLVKFIDAKEDLSIQVHPDDETARRHGHRRGKAEMWYVMESEERAKLRVGLKRWITPRVYSRLVRDGEIGGATCEYRVREGDVFYIPPGRIHAICGGTFLAEIQQTSDITYRIYDYGRRDGEGRLRELHTKKASEAIDYRVERDYQTHYIGATDRRVGLVRTPYFTTSLYDVREGMEADFSWIDSFVVLIGLKGEGKLKGEDGDEIRIKGGETILLPATTGKVYIEGEIKMLETHV